MTHDELLAEIKEAVRYSETSQIFNQANGWVAGAKALLAVVELHKPIFHPDIKGIERCSSMCNVAGQYVNYPCPTIQAIEKELR